MLASRAVDDVQEIKNQIYSYAELLDGGDIAGFAALFEHATFRTNGVDFEFRGADAVQELIQNVVPFYAGVPATKHVITNVIVEIDGSGATARSSFTVFQSVPEFPLQPILAGRYHDRFERIEGRWRYIDHLIFLDLFGDTRFHVKGALGSD
jgi:3-phenylpropionate/cinnamic acid dioxygenase small subunit